MHGTIRESSRAEPTEIISYLDKQRFRDELDIVRDDATVALHGVADAFPDLNVSNPAAYGTRASVYPAAIALMDKKSMPSREGSDAYMHSLHLGPERIEYIDVPEGGSPLRVFLEKHFGDANGESLFSIPDTRVSIFGQSETTERIFTEFALSRGLAEGDVTKLKAKLGLPSLEAASTASSFNDKGIFRTKLNEFGIGALNPQFETVSSDEPLDATFDEKIEKLIASCTRNKSKPVVAKVTNLATGEGVKMCSSVDDVKKFIETHREAARTLQKETPRFIIEENVFTSDRADEVREMSAQFFINHNGNVFFLGATMNNMGANADGDMVVHQGNLVATDSNHEINAAIDDKTKGYLLKLMEQISQEGYRGYLGVDLIKTAEGDIKALEVNMRVTGAAYPLLAMKSLAATGVAGNGNSHFVVLSDNYVKVEDKEHPYKLDGRDEIFNLKEFADSFEGLRALFMGNYPLSKDGTDVENRSHLLFEKGSKEGVIPYFIALPDKFGILVVAKDAARAQQIRAAAHARMRIGS